MKTKYFLFALTLLGSALALSSCDKIKYPVIGSRVNPTPPPNKVLRKVLIEDFTAQQCPNCPKAALDIETIKKNHPNQVISIGEHVGSLANPGAAPYNHDFKTKVGNVHGQVLGSNTANLPTGAINRMDFSGGVLKNRGDWNGLVTNWLAKAPDADIKITNNYDASSRQLNTSVKTKFLQPLTGTYKLVVLLTEDSIQSTQKMPDGSVNPDYIHRHVLRDKISTFEWGDTLISGSVNAGDSVLISIPTYTLAAKYPASVYGAQPVEKNCYVVAYIYNADIVPTNPKRYEIVQVEEKKMIVK